MITVDVTMYLLDKEILHSNVTMHLLDKERLQWM